MTLVDVVDIGTALHQETSILADSKTAHLVCVNCVTYNTLVVRRTRLSTYGDRAFPVAASRVWNSLPHQVTSAQSLPVFRSRLKTHLFRRSFP